MIGKCRNLVPAAKLVIRPSVGTSKDHQSSGDSLCNALEQAVKPYVIQIFVVAVTLPLASACFAQSASCPVNADQLTTALKQSVMPGGGPCIGCLVINEWSASVDLNLVVCALTFSGHSPSDHWAASRAISAE